MVTENLYKVNSDEVREYANQRRRGVQWGKHHGDKPNPYAIALGNFNEWLNAKKNTSGMVADMSELRLIRADLSYGDFSHTRMVDAVLQDANMNHVVLTGTDLTGADMTGARLNGARFTSTILNGVQANGISAMNATVKSVEAEGLVTNNKDFADLIAQSRETETTAMDKALATILGRGMEGEIRAARDGGDITTADRMIETLLASRKKRPLDRTQNDGDEPMRGR